LFHMYSGRIALIYITQYLGITILHITDKILYVQEN